METGPVLGSLALSATLALLAVARPGWGRVVFGLLFICAALVNAIGAVVDARGYAAFAESALLPLYARAWQSVFVPYLPVWLFVLVLYELGTGLTILFSDRLRRYGYLAALVFTVALVPANPMTLGNLFLAASAAWLLWRETPDRPSLLTS